MEINEISKENNKIKNEQNYLNQDIIGIREINEKLRKENNKLKEDIKIMSKNENENKTNLVIINKLKSDINNANMKMNNSLKDKEQLLLKIQKCIE